MRLPTGKLHPRAIAGSRAKVGDSLVWKGTEYGAGVVDRYVASMAGALAVSTSPPWVARRSGVLRQVRCLLGTAGSTSTVVTVYKNGGSIGTVTLTSGQTNVAVAFSTAFTADTDLLTVAVTTAGTGAANLTVLGWFM